MKYFLIVTTIFLFNTRIFGQKTSEASNTWTLEACIDHAIKNSIDIQRSSLNLESSKNNYDQALASFLPSVNAGGAHNYNYGRTIDRATNQFVDQNTQNGGMEISGSLNLFNGLQNQSRLKQTKFLYNATLAEIEQVKNNVSLNVVSLYLTIIFNLELLEAATLQLESSVHQMERTQKLVQAGALPEANLLEIKAQRATDELNVVNAESQLEISKLNLKQALLIPADQEFEIVIPQLTEFEASNADVSSSEVFKTALETQPGIKGAQLRIRGARYGESVARSGRFPSLNLGGGINTNYSSFVKDETNIGYSQQIDQNRGQYIRLSLNIPIFNNLQYRNQIQAAIINRKSIELDAINTKNQLRQDVEQAAVNAKTALKRYQSTQNQVNALRESFRVTEQRFELGVVNPVDFTVSKNNLNRAESDFIRAKYDFIFRTKILDFYQNKPITF